MLNSSARNGENDFETAGSARSLLQYGTRLS